MCKPMMHNLIYSRHGDNNRYESVHSQHFRPCCSDKTMTKQNDMADHNLHMLFSGLSGLRQVVGDAQGRSGM